MVIAKRKKKKIVMSPYYEDVDNPAFTYIYHACAESGDNLI